MRGNDIFDLRAVLRLLNAQRIKQDALIWKRFANPFQLSQMPVRFRQCRPDFAAVQRADIGQREWRELAHRKKTEISLSLEIFHVKKNGISFHDGVQGLTRRRGVRGGGEKISDET